jgi:putative ABC transport system permease protein
MTPTSMPPRSATRLLRRALPADVRDSVEGDLCELYVRRRAQWGHVRASLWYWREAFAFSARFAIERIAAWLRILVGPDGMPSMLDFKLGGRMLLKHPGLAVVGGIGMAVATAIGAGAFAFFNLYLFPDLPLHEGERVVTVANWDTRYGNDDQRVLHDFLAWRSEAKSLVDVGAFRTSRRNLIDATGQADPVTVAEMSAAGFRVARVAPMLGGVFIDADERAGAAPVIVIGYDVWTNRFERDPRIVGRTMRLGRTTHTIVGVMPDGFKFPLNHDYWVPLRADPNAYAIGQGPDLTVFARLAPTASKERAQAELAVIGKRMAEAYPATHGHLTPRVMAYTEVFADTGGANLAFLLVQSMLALLLVVVCLNVAVLVYARTITRTGEIAVRTALGATRGRIVTQLFVEALVLSLIAGLAGLGFVAVGLRHVDKLLAMEGGAPFWVNPGLSVSTALYTLGLALLGAVVVGVLPALRATRAQLRSTLSALAGASKPQLGRTWTTLIVTQVAITVAALPPAMILGEHWVYLAVTKPGFAVEEFLSAGLLLEREEQAYADADLETPAFRNAMRVAQTALVARLDAEPAVTGVTFATEIPGNHWYDHTEFEGTNSRRSARSARVAVNYFGVFGVTFVAGRAFTPGDLASANVRPVIVNRTFAEQMPPGGRVLGRRIRFVYHGDTGRRAWHEIVGVVDDFPAGKVGVEDPGDTKATVYQPIAMGELQGTTIFVRMRGQASPFASRLRAIAAAADPSLQLRRVQSLDTAYALQRRDWKMAALALVLVIGSVLLISAAGVYALMSFTISQRRREIGVRVALGADARRILMAVLGRAAMQLALGVGVGLALVGVVDFALGRELAGRARPFLIPATALLMAVVGLIAAIGPARRGLRIQPTEALRSD